MTLFSKQAVFSLIAIQYALCIPTAHATSIVRPSERKPANCPFTAESLEKAAMNKDVGAAFLLSGAYFNGVCVKKDVVKAAVWGSIAFDLYQDASKSFSQTELLEMQNLRKKTLHASSSPTTKTIQLSIEEKRNAQRRTDVNTLLNAVYQYSIDNKGAFPTSISTTPKEICSSKIAKNCSGLVDLNVLIGNYLNYIMKDPLYKGENGTRYLISNALSSDGKRRITLSAPDAESGVSIRVTR